MTSKVILQKMCTLLNISSVGKKDILKNRICTAINEDPKENQKRDITNTIIEMLDDDAELSNIAKYLKQKHKFIISKSELNIFADIWDAAKKNDYLYIEEYIEQNRISSKILNLLAYTNNKKLIDIIS
jgi:hypothetical protein